ncbi:hypothetical protein [Mycolicibacterium sp.]|uniref:hypothetical protein n=1 Tax=Mycolicibacterium sp. TaxID=2320850 RepID=UPI001A2B849A|nr:hypothetical protein [Mycolicibacterium sp.]MBJ7338198.1 hypothetical protein [Mycolicibacterium sp.]
MMNAKRILAGMAVAGGLAAGALGVSTGVASAETGHDAPVPASWATDRGDHGGWDGDHGRGGDWNRGWNNGGWNNGWNNGGGPIPGGWNGGWEPNGGICIGPFCV